MCTDSSCQGDLNEKCTEGILAGCNCFNVPSRVVNSYAPNWLSEQQLLLAMLSAHDPGWEYTTGTSAAIQESTTTPNATLSATAGFTTTVSSTTSWYVNSRVICSHFDLTLSLRIRFENRELLRLENSLQVWIHVSEKQC